MTFGVDSSHFVKAGSLRQNLRQIAFKFSCLSTKCCACDHHVEATVMLSWKL